MSNILSVGKEKEKSRLIRDFSGINGPNRIRTDDLFHAMEALYQLIYGPLWAYAHVTLTKLARQHKYYFCDAGAERQGAKKYLCG